MIIKAKFIGKNERDDISWQVSDGLINGCNYAFQIGFYETDITSPSQKFYTVGIKNIGDGYINEMNNIRGLSQTYTIESFLRNWKLYSIKDGITFGNNSHRNEKANLEIYSKILQEIRSNKLDLLV